MVLWLRFATTPQAVRVFIAPTVLPDDPAALLVLGTDHPKAQVDPPFCILLLEDHTPPGPSNVERSFCAASVVLSLASTAFCAISRSMLACKFATDVRSPVASAGCSGTRRGDSVGVTDAFRVQPRRDLSSVYSLQPGQLPNTY